MRARSRLLGTILCVAVVSALLWQRLHASPRPLAAAAIGGRLELAAGDVQVLRDGKLTTSASGTPLPDHAQVRTGQGARALLRLVGGATAFVGDGSDLQLKGQGLALTEGKVWLDIPALAQPVTHELGEVSVAVSDAGLSIERHGGQIEVYVARGLAVVSATKARREVAAGERAVIAAGGELKVEPVAFWDDWTGGMADRGMAASLGQAGSGRIYAVDRAATAGTPAQSLSVQKQSVRARIADGVAETEVDQTFWNAGDRAVEGFYWFTVPADAIVTGFALETAGVLVEGEVVERKQAAAHYEAAIARASDPALLEWINDRTYRARIYPIAPVGSRRVVLRYVQPVALGEGRIRWLYPMAQTEADAASIDELSLSVELGSLGADSQISTLPDARIEDNGRRVTMRRSVFTPRADFVVELSPKHAVPALRATRFATGGDQADFVMLRWVPDVDWSTAKRSVADLVVAVDVSAGGDDADRQLKSAVAEAILRNLSAGDHFALMTTDVAPHVIYPETGLAQADPVHVAQALERLASVATGGATDLGAMFDPGLSRLHGAEQPALVYIGDGQATCGELRGADVVERLRRSLEGARARFFTVGVGDGANHPLLERLAAVGGGKYFPVDSDAVAVPQALQLAAAVKTPTITDLSLDVGVGLDEPLWNAAGKLARGQELLLLARTHHDLPKNATVHGRLGGKPFTRTYALELHDGAATPLVPRFWASEFARRLLGRASQPEDARAKVVALSLQYGLVTPFSSILALDSEAAYSQAGIERRHRAWDRLPLEQAALSSSASLQTALGVALSPLCLLQGCSTHESLQLSPADRRQELGPVATSPVAPEPSAQKEKAMAEAQGSADERARADVAQPSQAPSAARTNADLDVLDDMAAAGSLGGSLGFVGHGYGGAARVNGNAAPAAPRTRSAFAKRERAPEPAPVAEAKASLARATAYVLLRTCSDAASRPLSDREVLWQRRLRSAQSMAEALELYDAARAACEVPTQHDQRALLGRLPPFATSAQAAEELFAHFAHDSQAVALLARHVLRRTFDPYVAAIARREAHGGSDDWPRLELALAALATDEARIARLRETLLASPSDLDVHLRLLKLLLRNGRRDEALPLVARVRAHGLFSPALLRELGDLQVAAGLRDEALRTYTEIVEFEPDSAQARKLVGDTLLENGWYELAYRQFRSLVEQTPADAGSEIRLALAAAGSGRTDEALRILRAVAESDAEPGPTDPRQQARLLASAVLARLLMSAPTSSAQTEVLTRQLKQLQVLPSPGRLCLLTWDSLDQSLGLGAVSGDLVDAAGVGLVALGSPTLSLQALLPLVRARSELSHGQRVHFRLQELRFDGNHFQVEAVEGDAG